MIYKILFHLTLGISLVSEQYDQVPHMSVFDASTRFEFNLHKYCHFATALYISPCKPAVKCANL